MRILKEKGDLIFNEEMEELQEPFNAGEAPEPTSEEVPTDDGMLDEEMPEDGLEPPMDDIEEDPVGIDPADSFFPPNEDYDYAPDVYLTGNPNDGIKYPSGAEPVDEEQIVPEPAEGELGIQEKVLKKQKEMAWRDNNAKKFFVTYDNGKQELVVTPSLPNGERDPSNAARYQNISWSQADFNEFVMEFGGKETSGTMSTIFKDPRPELESVFGKTDNNYSEGKSMKILTQKEAMEQVRKNILEAKKLMKEFDFNAAEEPTYDIENPPVDDEMGEDMMGEESMEDEAIEEEAKSEDELIVDILADAEELFKKIVGEEDMSADDMMDEEVLEDEQVPSIEMMEAKKIKRAKLIEKIKKAKRIKELKGKIKDKIKESMKPGIDMGEDDELANVPDLRSEDEDLMDTLYMEKKKAKAKKIQESSDSIHELFVALNNSKYGNNPATEREAFEEACEILGHTTKSKDAQEAWKMVSEGYATHDGSFDGDDSEEEEEGKDEFFEEAKKRSEERKAYLRAILNEEDTPTMADQSEVEELMGLKILKKMGEDPKLVESRPNKFKENYSAKKAFNFKELLNNGFLG